MLLFEFSRLGLPRKGYPAALQPVFGILREARLLGSWERAPWRLDVNSKIPGVFLLVLFYSCAVWGQLPTVAWPSDGTHTPCILQPGPFERHLFIPPDPPKFLNLRAFSISAIYLPQGSTLDGNTCNEWPAAAMTAFDYAISIWRGQLTLNRNITINACWTPVGGLGYASSSFTRLPNYPASGNTTWYPIALAEHLLGQEVASPEFSVFMNSGFLNWYFGTDGNPTNLKVDFVTTALHELGHGFGFLGFASYSGGLGSYGPNEEIDIFSRRIKTNTGVALTSLTSPSVEVGNLLRGIGGSLLDNNNVKLYTPDPFSSSSYSHYDGAVHPTELMKPVLNYGQAIHSLGGTSGFMSLIGWGLGPLPVELTRFEAAANGKVAELLWESQHELNFKGFGVERSMDGIAWETLGFVPGKGNAQGPQTYAFADYFPFPENAYYRLKLEDWDGSVQYSAIRAVQVPFEPEALYLFPIPAAQEVWVRLPPSANPVAFNIVNPFGQILLTGSALPPLQRIDIRSLPSGWYLIDLEGLPTKSFIKAGRE